AKNVALYPRLTTKNPAAALLSEPAIPWTVPSTPRAVLYRPVPTITSAFISSPFWLSQNSGGFLGIGGVQVSDALLWLTFLRPWGPAPEASASGLGRLMAKVQASYSFLALGNRLRRSTIVIL